MNKKCIETVAESNLIEDEGIVTDSSAKNEATISSNLLHSDSAESSINKNPPSFENDDQVVESDNKSMTGYGFRKVSKIHLCVTFYSRVVCYEV